MASIAKRAGAVVGALLVAALVLIGAAYLAWVPRAQQPPYRLVASWGHAGSGRGEFADPNGVAASDDRVYVADSRNHRIQVFDRLGHFQKTIPVPDNGRPMNLALANGKLYAADYWNDDVLVYGLDGRLLNTFGTPGHAGQRGGEFNSPGGVAVAADSKIYVADFYNQRVQVLAPDGRFLRQWGETGNEGVFGGKFNYPIDVAVARDGDIYVADGYNDRIKEFAPDGHLIRQWGGPFAANIRGPFPGWFKTPTGIAIGPHGDVFVADQENNRVQKFSADGKFLTAFGTRPRGPTYTVAAVAVAPDGVVYVTNLADNRVEIWRPTTDSTAK